MAKTNIQWADEVWNPVTGCTPVSAGCFNCYAEKMAYRLKAIGQSKYKHGFVVRCHPDELDRKFPRKPQKIFVCSMGDLFHEAVPFSFIKQVFRVMEKHPQHTFIILTKRPHRLESFLTAHFKWLPNIWLGVSVENQRTADLRISILLRLPAAKWVVSIEPLLGTVDLHVRECLIDKRRFKLTLGNYLDWVIVGCESGHKRRPCKIEWIRAIKDQCVEEGVPIFIKQMEINGKVCHDASKFPTDLQLRQKPKGASNE